MKWYQKIPHIVLLCMVAPAVLSQGQLEDLGEVPADALVSQQPQDLPTKIQEAQQQEQDQPKLVDPQSQPAEDVRIKALEQQIAAIQQQIETSEKKQSQLGDGLVEAKIWLMAVGVFAVIVAGVWLSWRVRDASQSEVRGTLEAFSKKLDRIEEMGSGDGPPPVVEVVSIESRLAKTMLIITGRYLDVSPEVSVEGQSCTVEAYCHESIRARLPRSFGHESEQLNVLVKTDAGSSMLSIAYPNKKLKIDAPSVVALGGYTQVNGHGFTPFTRVWVNADPRKAQPSQSGYVDEDVLIVDWPSGTPGDDTTLVVRREDGEEVRWEGKY